MTYQKFLMRLLDMRYQRFPSFVILILPFVLFYPIAAAADTTSMALTETAQKVSDPARVTLIAIARAGDRLVAVGEHGVITVSDDNGKVWKQASVPTDGTITTVAFATPLQGWAAGDYGVILHTKDGGLTWQTQLNGEQVNQMMLTTARSLDNDGNATAAGALAVRRANIFVQAGPDKPFLSILAISPDKAFVFGAYRMAVATSDGGNNWQDISLNIGDPLSHNIYDSIISGKNIYLAEETGLILCSADDGRSFSQVTQPGGATLFGILAAENGNLLAYGVAGALFVTSDAGREWTPINLHMNTNLTAARVINNDQILVASQAGNVFVSSDDGLTFHDLPENLGMAVYDFEQAKNGDIIFVGSGGVRDVSLLALTGH